MFDRAKLTRAMAIPAFSSRFFSRKEKSRRYARGARADRRAAATTAEARSNVDGSRGGERRGRKFQDWQSRSFQSAYARTTAIGNREETDAIKREIAFSLRTIFM